MSGGRELGPPLKRRPAGDYEVGYGKPPEHGRFRKGQSGNPRGRPKGARNKPRSAPDDGLRAIIMEEAYRTIQVRDGERIVPLSMAQAVMRSLAINAAKGHQRAQRLFTTLVAATESESRRGREELFKAAIEYKVQWEKELERRAVLGISAPDPVPHPDHVHIDPRTGQVAFRGPMTKEEKAELDRWRDRKEEFEAERAELQRMLKKAKNGQMREFIRSDLAQTERILQMIGKVLPG